MYWYLDKNGSVLYVGKAKNLKARLSSYRRLNLLLPRTRKMLATAVKVKFQTTETELDALLTEAELIRLHQPFFNIRLKDDKSNLYIIITKESVPRVFSVHKNLIQHPKYPIKRTFGPFTSGYQVKKLLKIARKMFPFCSASPADIRLGKACFYSHLGLCPGICKKSISLVEYRQNIEHLTKFLAGKKKEVIKNLTKQLKQNSADLNFEKAAEYKRQLETIAYVADHYHAEPEPVLPNLHDDQGQESIFELKKLLINYLPIPKQYRFSRIECYDISNLQGSLATASMVVFKNGKPDKSSYRRFRIKTIHTPNDYAMLQETLIRRQKHPEWGRPNLIVIDGGKGQLKAVMSVMEWTTPVISIAKKPDRLIIPSGKGLIVKRLNPRSLSTKLLQNLRDESHRFAKSYHGLLHKKSYTQ